MATKQVRWKCEQCNSGVLAPTKPRKNDVRRYCLPCSAKTGKLVERVAPSLEKKREASKAKTADKQKAKRATVAKKREVVKAIEKTKKTASTYGLQGFNVEKEAQKIWKLLEPYHRGRAMPTISTYTHRVKYHADGRVDFNGRNNGQANIVWGRILLRPNVEWGTLAHELVHVAVGTRHVNGRDHAHDKAFYDCLRDVTQRRFKVNISFFQVKKYGYEVDSIIRHQLDQQDVYKIFRKKTEA